MVTNVYCSGNYIGYHSDLTDQLMTGKRTWCNFRGGGLRLMANSWPCIASYNFICFYNQNDETQNTKTVHQCFGQRSDTLSVYTSNYIIHVCYIIVAMDTSTILRKIFIPCKASAWDVTAWCDKLYWFKKHYNFGIFGIMKMQQSASAAPHMYVWLSICWC